MTFIPETTGVSALTSTGVGTCGADDNQAQAGHLVPMTDDDGATEREREMTLDLPTTFGTLSPGAHPGGVNGQDAYTGLIFPTRRPQ